MIAHLTIGVFVAFVPFNLVVSLRGNHFKLLEWISSKSIRARSLQDVELLSNMDCVLIDESFFIDYSNSEVAYFSVNNCLIHPELFNVLDVDPCL